MTKHTHIIEMVKEWRRLGHDVLLLTPPFDQKHLNLPLRVQVYPFFGYSFFRRIISYLFLSVILMRSLFKFAPDVLYERQMEFNPIIWFICRIFKLPFFIEINGLIAEDLKQTGSRVIPIFIHNIIEKKEFHSSAGMCCTSPILKKKIGEKYKNTANKVSYIPNGVNLNLFRPMNKRECRIKLGFLPELKYIGYVGTFNHLHDSEQVVESFKKVAEKITDLRLIKANCQLLPAENGYYYQTVMK